MCYGFFFFFEFFFLLLFVSLVCSPRGGVGGQKHWTKQKTNEISYYRNFGREWRNFILDVRLTKNSKWNFHKIRNKHGRCRVFLVHCYYSFFLFESSRKMGIVSHARTHIHNHLHSTNNLLLFFFFLSWVYIFSFFFFVLLKTNEQKKQKTGMFVIYMK